MSNTKYKSSHKSSPNQQSPMISTLGCHLQLAFFWSYWQGGCSRQTKTILVVSRELVAEWHEFMTPWLLARGEIHSAGPRDTDQGRIRDQMLIKGYICELDYIKTNMDIKYFSFSVLTYFNHSVNLPTVVTWLNEMGDVLTITDQFPENIECRSHPHEPPSRTHYAITIRGPCPGVTGAQFEVIMRGECVIRRMRPHIVWYEA